MTIISNYASKSFLLVEDEPFMREVIESILRQRQAEQVFRAHDGAAALELLAEKALGVHCIISDLNMKPMNGLQLLQAIRSGQNRRVRRDQPFIMLTGSAQSEAVTTAISLDVHGYVLKPVSPDKLVAAIDAASKRKIEIKSPGHYGGIVLPAA